MKPQALPRHLQVLSHLSRLPRKIIALYGSDHMSEFTLHELCHIACFKLEKAAYFVDNPDFDCFQGVAGYDHTEHNDSFVDELNRPQSFCTHLRSCKFNQRVRAIGSISYKRAKRTEADILKVLAPELTIKNPCCYVWPLKHGNYGILIYEKGNSQAEELKEHIENGIHLLSFCSLF